jgi:acyl dehydratase
MADKSAIDKSGRPFKMPIEWGKVREFARAIKDPNPAYFDPEPARREYGGVPIPVTFLMTSAFWQDEYSMPAVQFDLGRVLHGEQEFELLKPIYVGDVLTGVTRVADVYDKAGSRGGTMTFTVLETTYTKEKGERVAISRSVILETGQPVKPG